MYKPPVYRRSAFRKTGGFVKFERQQEGPLPYKQRVGGSNPSARLSNKGFVDTIQLPFFVYNQNGLPSFNRWSNIGTFRTLVSDTTDGSISPVVYKTPGPQYIPTPTGIIDPAFSNIFSFIPNANGTRPSCSPGGAINLMNNAENIAASNPPFNSNDTRTRWMLKRGLHSNILNDSINISASSVLQNFMSASANAPLGKIATLEMFLSKDSLSHDSTALQNALNLCNSINPSNIVEWTHKKVLSICIHGRINDDKFSNHQVNVLRTIANMCPFTNGTAVYQARVLLVPYDPIGTDYTNSCEDGGGNARLMNPEEIVVSQVIEFRLYPNPAQNEVVLEYDLGGCKAGVVEIYDRVGKKVFEYNVTFGKDLVILPLSGLRDGIYIAVLRIDGQVVKNQKLVIIR